MTEQFESGAYAGLRWSQHHSLKRLFWPDEQVVRFLSRQTRQEDRPQQSVLDVGCGTGRHIRLCLEMGFGAIAATDVDSVAVESAAREYYEHSVDVVEADCSDLPFAGQSFDVVLNYGVAMYRRPSLLSRDLTQIRRVLKDDGKLLINYRTPRNWFFGLGQALDEGGTYLLDERAGDYKVVYSFIEPDRARAMLEEAGFRVITEELLTFVKGGERLESGDTHQWLIYSAQASSD